MSIEAQWQSSARDVDGLKIGDVADDLTGYRTGVAARWLAKLLSDMAPARVLQSHPNDRCIELVGAPYRTALWVHMYRYRPSALAIVWLSLNLPWRTVCSLYYYARTPGSAVAAILRLW